MVTWEVLLGVTLIAAAVAYPWIKVAVAKDADMYRALRFAACSVVLAVALVYGGWVFRSLDVHPSDDTEVGLF